MERLIIRLSSGETVTFEPDEWSRFDVNDDGAFVIYRFDSDADAPFDEESHAFGRVRSVGYFRAEQWEWWRRSLSSHQDVTEPSKRLLGCDPATGRLIYLCQGRRGPYVTDGLMNTSSDAATIEEALLALRDRKLRKAQRAAATKDRQSGDG